eukprot:789030-Amphidinium_carterae.1
MERERNSRKVININLYRECKGHRSCQYEQLNAFTLRHVENLGVAHLTLIDACSLLLTTWNNGRVCQQQQQKAEMTVYMRSSCHSVVSAQGHVNRSARWAETFIKPLAYYQRPDGKSDYTLVYCNILTGITHQIRITMQSLGHPLVARSTFTRPLTCEPPTL